MAHQQNYEDIVINQGTDTAIEIHLQHDSGSAFDLTKVPRELILYI